MFKSIVISYNKYKCKSFISLVLEQGFKGFREAIPEYSNILKTSNIRNVAMMIVDVDGGQLSGFENKYGKICYRLLSYQIVKNGHVLETFLQQIMPPEDVSLIEKEFLGAMKNIIINHGITKSDKSSKILFKKLKANKI